VPTLLGAEGPFYQKKNDLHTFAEAQRKRAAGIAFSLI
jgi:hypothetical protein